VLTSGGGGGGGGSIIILENISYAPPLPASMRAPCLQYLSERALSLLSINLWYFERATQLHFLTLIPARQHEKAIFTAIKSLGCRCVMPPPLLQKRPAINGQITFRFLLNPLKTRELWADPRPPLNAIRVISLIIGPLVNHARFCGLGRERTTTLTEASIFLQSQMQWLMNVADWECLSDCSPLLRFWQQFQRNERRQLKPLFLDFNGKKWPFLYPTSCASNFTKSVKQYTVTIERNSLSHSQNIYRRHKKIAPIIDDQTFAMRLVCYECISLVKSSQTFITTLLQFSCAKLSIQRVSHIFHFPPSGTQQKEMNKK
jgi:hypothetical protein